MSATGAAPLVAASAVEGQKCRPTVHQQDVATVKCCSWDLWVCLGTGMDHLRVTHRFGPRGKSHLLLVSA